MVLNVGLMFFQYIVFTSFEERSWWRHGLRGEVKNQARFHSYVLRPTFYPIYFHR